MDAPYAIIKYWHPSTPRLRAYPQDTPVSKEDFLAVIERLVNWNVYNVMITKTYSLGTHVIWIDNKHPISRR